MGLVVLDNQFIEIASALISQAKREICLSSFKIEISEKPRGTKLTQFFNALAEKIKSGVRVRVLFNWHDNKRSVARTNWSASHTLRSAGADVRYLDNNRCCHAKVILIDQEKALLGSHNLSIRSISSNFEISYIVQDPESISALYSIFQRSFMDAKKI